jgi:lipoprotein-releasing system ATP-binding protein
MNDFVLELRGISKGYHHGRPNEIRVLDAVDLALTKGETTALIAPSGAGKSTLLHIAGLLDTADQGDVMLGGNIVSTASDRKRTKFRRQDIGFVYQFHHLLPEFSALENIMLPQLANGTSHRAAQARAQSLLDMVGLDKRGDHRPSHLSGGEQQRVAFCRALANNPRVLLADEPTGNLDQATSDQVFDVLLDVVRETGLTALIATHNPELAARMTRQVRLVNHKLISD